MKTHYLLSILFFFLLATVPASVFGQTQPVEICDNGLDDDGDGLIDCFDPDCCTPACATHYYNECPPPSCQFRPDSGALVFSQEWTYGNNWHEYNTPIVGDLDGDGIPEVIGKKGPYNPPNRNYDDLLVINGATGLLEATIQTPIMQWQYNAVGVMDADQDGYGEIYFTTSHNPTAVLDRDRLICYEYVPGTQSYAFKWRSVGLVNQPTGSANNANNNMPNFADFNSDGVPEIYVRNQLYNGLTGVQIVNGDTNSVGANTNFGVARRFAFPLAYDVLPDTACPDCAGLELVAGNQVYSVHVDPVTPANSRMTVVRQAAGGKLDGYTSIVDIDKDGDLDGIICTSLSSTLVEVYIWDLQTNTVLFSRTLPTNDHAISRANAADFDGDGLPEFGICTVNRYTVLEVAGGALVPKWTTVTTDGSGGTSSTVFDFEGDGKFEVIYRDETTLKVFNGATGQVLFTTPCTSGTSNEYPTIADVDADGETELLCSCGGELKVFKSGNNPWVPTRQLWNQQSFHNTNINGDLSIPKYIQSPHIIGDSVLMNTFLTQIQLKDYPSPDIATQLDFLGCQGDSLEIELTLCNSGNLQYPSGMPITFYGQDPTRNFTFPLYTTLNPISIDTGQCLSYSLVVPNLGVGTFYAVANDDFSAGTPYSLVNDFPVTSVGECNFENNIDSMTIVLPSLSIQDTIRTCGPDSVLLTAGAGWTSYQWSNGASTDSIWTTHSGFFTVTVEDSQNCFTSDETWVRILDASISPGDTTACLFDTLIVQVPLDSMAASNPLSYLWNTGGNINQRINQLLVTQNTQLISVVTDGGLVCSDTALITTMDRPTVDLGADSVIVCAGDSIWLVHPAGMATNLWSSGSNADSIVARQTGYYWLEASNVCGSNRDSVYLDALLGPTPVDLGVDTIICDGDNIPLDATQALMTYQWQDNSALPTFTANGPGLYWVRVSNQCGIQIDSIQIDALPDPLPFSLGADTTICQGDSIWLNHRQAQLNNLWVDNSTGDSLLAQAQGVYWLDISNLCGSFRDSINISYLPIPNPVDLGRDTLICGGDNIVLTATQPQVSYLWQDNSTADTLVTSGTGTYWVIVANQCGAQTDSIIIDQFPDPVPFSLGADTTICEATSVWLSHSQPGVSYQWIDNSTNDSLLVQTAGLYWLEVTNVCGSERDSIQVSILAPPVPFSLGNDSTLCEGQNVLLQNTATGLDFLWQDGRTSSNYLVTTPGQYWLDASNRCGAVRDTVIIDYLLPPAPFSLGDDVRLCVGDSFFVAFNLQNQVDYIWNDGVTDPFRWVFENGDYVLTASNMCGIEEGEFNVALVDSPNAVLPMDTTLCEDEFLALDFFDPNLDYYLWQDGSTRPGYIIDRPGVYQTTLANLCDTLRSTYTVDFLPCNCTVFMANAFSPNGDSHNDTYHPGFNCNPDFVTFQIYNRWGQLMFQANSLDAAWDGTFQDKSCTEGVYVWILKVDWTEDGIPMSTTQKGSVTLLR